MKSNFELSLQKFSGRLSELCERIGIVRAALDGDGGLPVQAGLIDLQIAEFFAEYVTWYHYSKKLGQPYRIRLLRYDEVLFDLSPLDFNGVLSRESSIQSLYSGN